jgi:hypothetical protein
MAVGDITYDNAPVRSAGDHYVVNGVLEADGTARVFALVNSQQSLLYCNLECTTDDGANDTRVVINVAANFSTSAPGSVAIQAESTDSFRFSAGYC